MNSKLVLGVILAVMVMGTITLGTGTMVFPSYATLIDLDSPEQKAPTVITGDNVYITWFTNEGTVNSNFKVGFRASTDGGPAFNGIILSFYPIPDFSTQTNLLRSFASFMSIILNEKCG